MSDNRVICITGTSKGIGRHLAQHYAELGHDVVGCSRSDSDFKHDRYQHFCLSVSDEKAVSEMFKAIRKKFGHVNILLNNAGIASMNHTLLTPLETLKKIYATNVFGSFLFCQHAAKLMQKAGSGRIVNFATVATPLKLEGEAVYASSKAAIVSLTEIMAREMAEFGITVNAVGPTPVKTDLIKSVPQEKMDALIARQAIRRFGEFRDIVNAIDFFISTDSDFITGQTLYLGGV